MNNYQKSFWKNEGYCLFTSIDHFKGVFNLVTKKNYWHKPTYDTLTQSLESRKSLILERADGSETVKLAMPLIGCGLDKLKWNKVKSIICDVFNDINIDITICYL